MTASLPFPPHVGAGTLWTTEPLDWEVSSNHIFQVVAFDCSMKQSRPVTITVRVNRVCRVGWKGEHSPRGRTPSFKLSRRVMFVIGYFPVVRLVHVKGFTPPWKFGLVGKNDRAFVWLDFELVVG